MGKLSIEEKAKAYDKALERAQALYNDKNEIGYANAESVLEEVFPLLKESEDEKIREYLIRYIDNTMKSSELKSKLLSWLEKQELKSNPYSGVSFSYNGNIWGMCARDNGVEILFDGELKAFLSSEKSFIYPTRPQPVLEPIKEEKAGNNNKVETKFKVGDWVVSPNGVYWHIDAIQNGRYEVTADTGQCGNWPLDTNIYHLWTIDDAKDGDVLTNGDFPCIFKRCDDNGSLYVYCGINAHNDFSILSEDPENVWDDYSKQYFPATKEQRDTLFAKMKESGYEWLEETKELKKIEQESAEWKQENVEELSEFENAMMHIGYSFFGKRGGLDPNDTSSVKVQAQYLLELAQKPAEWSEGDDDDAWMNDIISKVETNLQLNKAEIDWLKSLKQRIGG